MRISPGLTLTFVRNHTLRTPLPVTFLEPNSTPSPPKILWLFLGLSLLPLLQGYDHRGRGMSSFFRAQRELSKNRTTFLPKWLFYYVQGYFIIRMSKVRVSRFQWRRVRRERADLGHGLFGGNRQVPPRSSTSLYRYTNPRQYIGSAFQWLVESRSGMRYKKGCEVEFCFKKVYSDSKDVIARMPRAL